MKKYGLIIAILMETAIAAPEIPAIFANVIKYQDETMVMVDKDKSYPLQKENPPYTLEAMTGKIIGTDTGLAFDFGEFTGTLYYGLINFNDGKNPMPVFFNKSVAIQQGKANIKIKGVLSGKYDMVGWEKNGKGTLGYRLVNQQGRIIYDGRISFQGWGQGPFVVNVSFIEEPTVNNVTNDSAVIAFTTNFPSTAVVKLGDKVVNSAISKHHEVQLTNLASDTIHYYTVTVFASDKLFNSQSYSFSTAPKPGTRKPFVFGYASDSRAGQGGGERDIYGTNAYVMKKIMAVAQAKGAVFFQFTGDMIDGRLNNISGTKLQYQNWKRAIEPFNHYLPVYTTMGNHEGLFHNFGDGKIEINVDRFPFVTESAEAVFASQFVLPQNGPISEDEAEYDPNPQTPGDFPTYKENVYYYVYDNVAMVVLNTDYLFSPSFKYWFVNKGKKDSLLYGGGLHGYLMDKQLEWLEKVLAKLEADPNIDFVFATQHTPIFPNGGHKVDDMWYDGDNTPRPHIAGKPLRRGVIEQRDRYLDILLKHKKVVAVLTGDEHNYARMELTPETNIYLPNWDKPKVEITRSLWQVNNGAAGAPYYGQEVLPWSQQVKLFSTQNAVVFFHVDGQDLRIEVINPETLERIE